MKFHLFKKSQVKKLKELKNLNGIYLRTNDSYNLVSGGSLGHTLGIIDGLKSNCKKISYFGNDKINGISKNVDQFILPPSEFFNYINFTNRTIFSEKFSKKVINKLKNRQADFIYQRLSRDDISGAIISRALKVPLIVEYNSSMKWELMNSTLNFEKILIFFTNQLEKIMLKESSIIVVVSNVLRDELISKGYNESKIIVIPNGVDIQKFRNITNNDIANKINLSKDKITIGFSGTFGFWHGVDTLEDAIKIINDSKKVDCQFLMIGDGFYRKKMQNALKHYKNVVFTKNIPFAKIVKYLSICDILVSPHSTKTKNKFIGSPTKLFEYMSMEKIIVASNLDQIDEIISPSIYFSNQSKQISLEKYKNAVGIKYDQGNIKDLAGAIEFAVNNIGSLEYLGINARKKVIANYKWSDLSKKILKKLLNTVNTT